MQETVDTAAVKAVFPYGRVCCVDVVDGGLRANSGIAVAALGALRCNQRTCDVSRASCLA